MKKAFNTPHHPPIFNLPYSTQTLPPPTFHLKPSNTPLNPSEYLHIANLLELITTLVVLTTLGCSWMKSNLVVKIFNNTPGIAEIFNEKPRYGFFIEKKKQSKFDLLKFMSLCCWGPNRFSCPKLVILFYGFQYLPMLPPNFSSKWCVTNGWILLVFGYSYTKKRNN